MESPNESNALSPRANGEPQNEACVGCRQVKRKCIHDDDNTPCHRCQRLELECVYHQQKRGRKPGGPVIPRRRKASQPPVADSNGSVAALPPDPSPKTVNWLLSALHNNPSQASPSPLSSSTAGGSPITKSVTPVASGGFTLKRILENRNQEPPSQALADFFSEPGRESSIPNPNHRFFEDIVTGGVVPEEDVAFLFDFYFTHLNQMTSLLDPALHTALFVRSTSPFLFSAILTVAIRITRPALYPPSLKFVKALFGQCVEHSICTLEFVQAIATLVFWADAIDPGAARRLSYAVRCAYELKLDRKGQRPLPEDLFAARLVLNRERTWLHLCVADHRCSDQRGLPRLIAPDKIWDPISWHFEHHMSVPCPSEAGLAPLIGIGRLLALYEALVTTRDGELPCEALLSCLEAETQIWRSHWTAPDTLIPLSPGQTSLVRFCDQVFQFQIDECRLLLAVAKRATCTGPNNTPLLAFYNCIHSAQTVIEVFRQESLVHLYQDATWIGLASVAIWLVQNFGGMSVQDREASKACLAQAQITCEEASSGSQTMAAYTGRLFGHLLSKASTGAEPAVGSKNGFVMASPSSHFDRQWASALPPFPSGVNNHGREGGGGGGRGGGNGGGGGGHPGPAAAQWNFAGPGGQEMRKQAEANSTGLPFLNLMVKPQESLGEDLVYPTDDDRLWQSLFPMYGGQQMS